MSTSNLSYNEVIPKVIQTIRAASALAAQDINFHTSLDRNIASDLEESSKSLLSIANMMMGDISSSFVPISYGEDEVRRGVAWKSIANTLDVCFEKVDVAMDAVKNPNKKEAEFNRHLQDVDEPTPSEVKEKPQEKFRIRIDNSDLSPFKPKLTSKPHALRQLHESIQYVSESPDQTSPHYQHPYEYEIMNQTFPDSQLVPCEPIPPTDWDTTSATWVSTSEDLRKMIDELQTLTEIAIDLEHHDLRSYYGITCLMQISNREKDWLIDTLELRDDLQILNEIFANPAIVKIFHGANMDIIWLQRDLGLYIVSLFDTYHASKKLGFPKFSLAYLLETIAHFKTSKKYQLADWRIRPLTRMMSQYARADTHFLLYIYDVLRNKLIEKGVLQDVLYESRRVASRRFEFFKFKSDWNDWPRSNSGIASLNWLISQYNLPLTKKTLLDAVLKWRDDIARREDESPRFILSNQSLINLCTLSSPVDDDKIDLAIGKGLTIAKGDIQSLSNIMKENISETTDLDTKWEPSESFQESVHFLDACELNDLFASLKHEIVKTNLLLVEGNSSCFSGINLAAQNLAMSFGPSRDITVVTKEVMEQRMIFLKKQHREILAEQIATIREEPSSKPESIDANSEVRTEIKVGADQSLSPQLLTLTKRKIPARAHVRSESPSEPVFDYNAPDNANILGSIATELKGKKRSFDPFSKAGNGGPRAAKKSRNVAVGKSTSFKNKRK